MLVSSKSLLNDAQRNHYAIAAFNFYNLDILYAVLDAAEEKKSPVILQLYALYFSFLRPAPIAAAALAAIAESPVPVALHLDHSNDYDQILCALDHGFNSVMIDASKLPLKENMEITSKVVQTAHTYGAFTEAELGQIFRIGQTTDGQKDQKADPEEARLFVAETGVDSLAPAVGSAHGMYVEAPKLDFERIEAISRIVDVPLVLHGGSGTPDDMIKKAINCGIAKLNIGTELKYGWSKAIGEAQKNGEKEPRITSAYARNHVMEIAKQKIELCGSINQQHVFE
jgi:ketose-bisphosphate aldolase